MTRKIAAPPRSTQDALMLRRGGGRWENEGGAKTRGAEAIAGAASDAAAEVDARVDLTNTELVQLQSRVIALENLVTALLATAPEGTADLVRAIAANISPRADSTPHRLTIHAAAEMIHLLERGVLAKKSHPRGDD